MSPLESQHHEGTESPHHALTALKVDMPLDAAVYSPDNVTVGSRTTRHGVIYGVRSGFAYAFDAESGSLLTKSRFCNGFGPSCIAYAANVKKVFVACGQSNRRVQPLFLGTPLDFDPLQKQQVHRLNAATLADETVPQPIFLEALGSGTQCGFNGQAAFRDLNYDGTGIAYPGPYYQRCDLSSSDGHGGASTLTKGTSTPLLSGFLLFQGHSQFGTYNDIVDQSNALISGIDDGTGRDIGVLPYVWTGTLVDGSENFPLTGFFPNSLQYVIDDPLNGHIHNGDNGWSGGVDDEITISLSNELTPDFILANFGGPWAGTFAGYFANQSTGPSLDYRDGTIDAVVYSNLMIGQEYTVRLSFSDGLSVSATFVAEGTSQVIPIGPVSYHPGPGQRISMIVPFGGTEQALSSWFLPDFILDMVYNPADGKIYMVARMGGDFFHPEEFPDLVFCLRYDPVTVSFEVYDGRTMPYPLNLGWTRALVIGPTLFISGSSGLDHDPSPGYLLWEPLNLTGVNSLPVTGHPSGLCAKGTTLYFPEWHEDTGVWYIAAYDTLTNTQTEYAAGFATFPQSPRNARYDSVTDRVYIPLWGDGTIVIFNPNDHTFTTQAGFDFPYDVVFTPTARWAVQQGSKPLALIRS